MKSFAEIVAACHITPEELLAQMEREIQYVCDDLTQHPRKNYMPMLHGLMFDFKKQERCTWLYALAIPLNEPEEKRAVMTGLGKDIYERKHVPLLLTFSSEAWFSKQSLEGPRTQPRDDPDREEVIQFSSLSKMSKLAAMSVVPIIRNFKKQITLGERGPVVTEGVTVNILELIFDGFARAALAKIEKN